MKKVKNVKKTAKKIFYDKESDILWFLVKSGSEEEYREIAPGVGIEVGENGELLGIEIMNASKILKPLLAQKSPVTS